MEHTTRS